MRTSFRFLTAFSVPFLDRSGSSRGPRVVCMRGAPNITAMSEHRLIYSTASSLLFGSGWSGPCLEARPRRPQNVPKSRLSSAPPADRMMSVRRSASALPFVPGLPSARFRRIRRLSVLRISPRRPWDGGSYAPAVHMYDHVDRDTESTHGGGTVRTDLKRIASLIFIPWIPIYGRW